MRLATLCVPQVATNSLLFRSTKSSQENCRRRVAGLGGGGGQVVAQGVGVVLAQEVGHVHGGAATLAELVAPEVQVFLDTGRKIPSF
jgi:hypothetical protein